MFEPDEILLLDPEWLIEMGIGGVPLAAFKSIDEDVLTLTRGFIDKALRRNPAHLRELHSDRFFIA